MLTVSLVSLVKVTVSIVLFYQCLEIAYLGISCLISKHVLGIFISSESIGGSYARW